MTFDRFLSSYQYIDELKRGLLSNPLHSNIILNFLANSLQHCAYLL